MRSSYVKAWSHPRAVLKPGRALKARDRRYCFRREFVSYDEVIGQAGVPFLIASSHFFLSCGHKKSEVLPLACKYMRLLGVW